MMMAKQRLRTCLSQLFTGYRYGIASVSPKISRMLSIFQSEVVRIQIPNRKIRSYHEEQDKFAELGAPTKTTTRLKTEKPENLKRKVLNGTTLLTKGRRSLKDNSLEPSNSVPATSKSNDSTSIIIQNMPSEITLSQLTETCSVFGKISKASMRNKPNQPECCEIEFESIESYNQAISVGGITISNFLLPIEPLDLQEMTVTIRISNISSETSYSTIHSMCMAYGTLEGLSRTKDDDVVDALFQVNDDSNTRTIIKKLDSTVVNECKWSARLCSEQCRPAPVGNNEDDSRGELGAEVNRELGELRRKIRGKIIDVDDLEYLQNTLMHLENHPNSRM